MRIMGCPFASLHFRSGMRLSFSSRVCAVLLANNLSLIISRLKDEIINTAAATNYNNNRTLKTPSTHIQSNPEMNLRLEHNRNEMTEYGIRTRIVGSS